MPLSKQEIRNRSSQIRPAWNVFHLISFSFLLDQAWTLALALFLSSRSFLPHQQCDGGGFLRHCQPDFSSPRAQPFPATVPAAQMLTGLAQAQGKAPSVFLISLCFPQLFRSVICLCYHSPVGKSRSVPFRPPDYSLHLSSQLTAPSVLRDMNCPRPVSLTSPSNHID